MISKRSECDELQYSRTALGMHSLPVPWKLNTRIMLILHRSDATARKFNLENTQSYGTLPLILVGIIYFFNPQNAGLQSFAV